ncbi:Amidase [Popillia japonica]|uniref:Amidase n=1 Tax=Popillia japonica TaxID=7064 RepID=A0AAW1JVH1_POPJA
MNIFMVIYTTIRFIIDYTVDFLFGLYFNRTRQFISTPNNKLVLESATCLAQKIRKKEVTSEAVVKAFIDRINEVNPILNAVVDKRFEEALDEARQIDVDIRSLSITFGLVPRQYEFGEKDAKVVELMKKAGGILIGVTNIPQLNRWVESYNPVYGKTCNPYNTTRNVGGSTGGEACIIAARGSPIGIGTDIGGSIRIPAFRCGIFGHKPSNELISTAGLTFRTGVENPTMVTAGPVSAHSEDLMPLLKVLLDDNVNKLQLNKEVDIKKVKIYYMLAYNCFKSSPMPTVMQEVVLKCTHHFDSVSETKPKEVVFENTKYGTSMWMHMLTKEKDNFSKQIMNNNMEASPFGEIFKYIYRQSDLTIYSLINILNEKVFPKVNAEWAEHVMKQLKDEIIETLGDDGVLLCPSEAYPAGYHYTSVLRPYNFSCYSIWNALKVPVTQVPVGLNKDGLPIGIQVVGAPMHDHLCLAVAKELENAFGGYVPPFPVNN